MAARGKRPPSLAAMTPVWRHGCLGGKARATADPKPLAESSSFTARRGGARTVCAASRVEDSVRRRRPVSSLRIRRRARFRARVARGGRRSPATQRGEAGRRPATRRVVEPEQRRRRAAVAHPHRTLAPREFRPKPPLSRDEPLADDVETAPRSAAFEQRLRPPSSPNTAARIALKRAAVRSLHHLTGIAPLLGWAQHALVADATAAAAELASFAPREHKFGYVSGYDHENPVGGANSATTQNRQSRAQNLVSPHARADAVVAAANAMLRDRRLVVLIAEEMLLSVARIGARMRLPPDALCMPLPYARDRGSGGDGDNDVARERICPTAAADERRERRDDQSRVRRGYSVLRVQVKARRPKPRKPRRLQKRDARPAAARKTCSATSATRLRSRARQRAAIEPHARNCGALGREAVACSAF